MGSVSTSIDCPTCGNEAQNEMYYKSGEEFISCHKCGYERSFIITNYADMPDTPGIPDVGFEWIPNYEIKEVHGVGTYWVKFKGFAASERGSFLDIKGVDSFKDLVNSRLDEIEYAEYTTYEMGVFDTVVLKETTSKI